MMNGRLKNSLNYHELYDEVTAFAHFRGFFFPSCSIHTQKFYPNLCPRQKNTYFGPFFSPKSTVNPDAGVWSLSIISLVTMSRQTNSSKVIFKYLHFVSTQLRRCLGKVCVGDPHGLHHLHLLLRLHHSPHHHPHLLHEAHQDNPTEGTYYVCDSCHKARYILF